MSAVVVAWTPDRFGTAAVTYGVAEARLRDARLVVVNGSRGDALVDEEYAGADALADLDRELDGVEHEIRQVVAADVAEAVVDVAAEVDGVLVVVGVRHRTTVGKLLMGSVAQRLVLEAPLPVVCVKPPR